MKRLGITQRVEVVVDYNERRDCLDQRWLSLSYQLGFVPIPLPNIAAQSVAELIDALSLDAIILSSGNSIASLNPKAADAAPERDAFETALIDEAQHRGIPLLGVCRGMQMINKHFDGELSAISGHVGKPHLLVVEADFADTITASVNSFHNWAIAPGQLSSALKPIARDSDDNVEAFVHRSQAIAGIMWHPEREAPFKSQDIELMKHFLK